MGKLLAVIINDSLLLLKDKMGLLILFILPMCLVLVMSLMQANLNEQGKSLNVALIQVKNSPVNLAITEAFEKNNYFKVKKFSLEALERLKQQVGTGKYQALIIIKKHPVLFLDPSMPSNLANSLTLACRYTFQSTQLRLKNIKPITLKKEFISAQGISIKPSTAQQNVPAWTLFGIFFIVVPLASQMLRERQEGISERLKMTPSPAIVFILGRNIAYLILNLIQVIFMFMIGIYALPKLGVIGFTVTGSILKLFSISVIASLAATGFGIFIGSWCKTQQQISAVGPFVIVIVAAMSGIFIPVYLMPDIMVKLSQFSPMHWAQQAFLDVLVRNINFIGLLPNLLKLFSFYIFMICLACLRI